MKMNDCNTLFQNTSFVYKQLTFVMNRSKNVNIRVIRQVGQAFLGDVAKAKAGSFLKIAEFLNYYI